MQPIIGILTAIDDERTTTLLCSYAQAIEKSGGVPLLLPYVENDGVIDQFVSVCDGFFFTGGKDIEPSRYGKERIPTCGIIQKYRDELEFKVFAKAFQTQKPILGVCRGAQVINVALGGTLYQDIPSQLPTEIAHRQSEAKNKPSHEVKILKNTPLYALIGKERMQANSFHHQAINKLGRGLEIMALADDGVIEAVYLIGKRYLNAYQWHPERLCETDGENKKIFDDFIQNCLAGRLDNSSKK